MNGTIGIIGLGIMGGAMARNLVDRGWPVTGFDIDAGRRSELAGQGVRIVDSVAALAREVSILVTSLPSPSALHEVVEQIASAALGPRVLAETSTLALDDKLQAARRLTEAGHVALDCPLSGTGAQAQVRDLVVYASGDPAAIAAVRPVFLDCAREVHDLGAYGNGTRMKLVANLLVAIHNVASAEAMVLGIKAGLDPHQVVELIGAGVGTSRVFELRAPLMAQGRYEPPTMRVATWQKDMAIIGQFAASLACPTPLLSATAPIYAAAMAAGHGGRDTASVCSVLEAMAGVTRSPSRPIEPDHDGGTQARQRE